MCGYDACGGVGEKLCSSLIQQFLDQWVDKSALRRLMNHSRPFSGRKRLVSWINENLCCMVQGWWSWVFVAR